MFEELLPVAIFFFICAFLITAMAHYLLAYEKRHEIPYEDAPAVSCTKTLPARADGDPEQGEARFLLKILKTRAMQNRACIRAGILTVGDIYSAHTTSSLEYSSPRGGYHREQGVLKNWRLPKKNEIGCRRAGQSSLQTGVPRGE